MEGVVNVEWYGQDYLHRKWHVVCSGLATPNLDNEFLSNKLITFPSFLIKLAALAQMVACLPLVQQVRGSIPGGVVNFHLKILNFGARRGGDVHFLIARLYITVLD